MGRILLEGEGQFCPFLFSIYLGGTNMSELMIGVDIGTTSTKAVLFNKKGETLYRHGVEYPLHTPAPGTAEQDPEEIFHAVIGCIKEVTSHTNENIGFVSFSSAMHSLILVDKNDQPLTPSITWADNRSEDWARNIKNEHNGMQIYLSTGTPIHPMSPLVKLAWFDMKIRIFSKAAKFISIKEFVFYRLFGKYVVDYSIASATGLFNLEQLDWDEEALKVAGVKKDQLSLPVSTTERLVGLKSRIQGYVRSARKLHLLLGQAMGFYLI